MTAVTNYEYEGVAYARINEKGCWLILPEDLELDNDNFIAYKLTDTMMLLSPNDGTPYDRLLNALGSARLLKSKKNTVKFDRSISQKISWEDEWEVFIYSSFEDYVLLGVSALDEMEYLELRGIPAVISLPTNSTTNKG